MLFYAEIILHFISDSPILNITFYIKVRIQSKQAKPSCHVKAIGY